MPHITEAERLEPATIEYVTRYICKNCNAVWAGSKPKYCPECGYEIRKIVDVDTLWATIDHLSNKVKGETNGIHET